MREIKFRAWFKNDVVEQMLYDKNPGDCLVWKNQGQDIESIMQYTGLKDKNGKEIYEGDIVEFNDFDSLRTGGHTEDNILQGSISFSCGGWIVKTERGHYDLYTAIVNDEELEIIGNIYEHSELIQS